MKKTVFALFFLTIIFSSQYSYSQLTKATIGVDGFTCSLCAKGVQGQFESLDFVKSVKADLKNTQFVLTFNSKPAINIKDLNNAVTDGGFTVRDISIVAKGTLKGNGNSGYWLSASNIPDIKLKNINGTYSEGDKISLEGVVNPKDISISVTSIKKL